jgi:hypothetical protein
LKFNIPVSEQDFSIDIPEKAFVQDIPPLKPLFVPGQKLTKEELENLAKGIHEKRSGIGYRSAAKGTISFADNAFELEKLPWLVKEKYKEDEPEIPYVLPSSGGVSGVVRFVIAGTGMAIFVAAIFLLLKKRL